jgi:protein TonB
MNDFGTIAQFSHVRLHASFARQNRLLILAAAASLTLHVLGIAVLPGVRRLHEPVQRALDVILARPNIPAVAVAEPPRPKPIERPRELPRHPKRFVQETPQPTRTPLAEPQQKPVLSLPQTEVSTPNTFTLPQAVAEPPAPPAERNASVVSTPSAPREPATIPPSFNAAYLRNAPPRYPLLARRNGIEGTVRLKVLVTPDGRPAQVQLEHSSGSTTLDGAALEAVRNWQFVPARRGQDPIESWVLVPVVFKLENTG